MPSLVDQTVILEKIANILFNSAPEHCESISCMFSYDHGYTDGSYSVKEEFEYQKDGKQVFALTDDPSRDATKLVVELHSMMKAHTGGDWNAFTLRIDSEGKAHTKFHYPE